MMFKGSAKVGPGEASRILRDLGADENAFTSDDYTAYYQVLARDRLPVALELEADRLASLRLPADEFSREIEVIKEERRLRTDDQPNAKAFELFRAMAYPASGYHTPTIGWMADLERMKVEELRHWYESWYAPTTPPWWWSVMSPPTRSRAWRRSISAIFPNAPYRQPSCLWSWPNLVGAS